ncbi:hypothetical protein O3U67_10840 [Brevundimonas diminuta]|uniref:hypothetical protein n=1 Tax=Brevundimonas diminuta TaxID=293 RepID=UPI0022B00EFA|nr:hypothetical protein [Brevundimonas diminuta]MCZ4108578.1 hypothetical protein [Brevundimonas diminuta]
MSRLKPTGHGSRDTFPINIPDLLDWLDRACPELAPTPTDTLEKVMFEAGRRDMVRFIRREFERSLQRPQEG